MDYHLFKYIRGDKVIIEGNPATTVFLIKNGSYRITMKKKLLEVNDLLRHFGGKIKHNRKEKNLLKDSDKFKKFMNERNPYSLGIIKDNETLGLEDCVYNGKYFISAECTSLTGEIFQVQSEVII